MITELYIAITAGPSREELFDALKYAYDKNKRFYVTFTGIPVTLQGNIRSSGSKGVFKAKVIGISHEDGSGSSFIIEAYMNIIGHDPGKLVKFYYSARTRTGQVNLVKAP